MLIHQVIFRSSPTRKLSGEEFFFFAGKIQHDVREHNLTGLIIFYRGQFLHILEGDTAEVKHMVEKIKNDEDYSELDFLFYSESEKRHFPMWFSSSDVYAIESIHDGLHLTIEELKKLCHSIQGN